MPDPVLATLSLALCKRPLESLYESASAPLRKRLRYLRNDAKLRQIYKCLSSMQNVKTMWSIAKELKLQTFYYPSKVLMGESARAISEITEIEKSLSFVIQGTVGQGKSIFLRYLGIRELVLAERIPIFVELRRFDRKMTFQQFLLASLAAYGFDSDLETFDYFASSGKMVLLLDGFDEIEGEAVTAVVTELELLSQKYPQLQVVITSRPESGIEKSPHFRVYQLAPLMPTDHRPFLEMIITDKRRVNEIVGAITKSEGQIQSLLQTPLLLTLLVIVYNATQEIPPSLSAFYEELFRTLLTRHDANKPGFRRRRASKLSDSDLKRLFEAFCYAVRQQNALVLTHSAMERIVKSASQVTGIACAPEDFAKDITKVTCLMQMDGFQYQFVHKSVVEFHAANFIAGTSSDTASKFYEALLAKKWGTWRQELEFLAEIDRYRYLKFFLSPSLDAALRHFEVSEAADSADVIVTPDRARNILNKFRLKLPPLIGQSDIPQNVVASNPGMRVQWAQPNLNFATERIEMSLVAECIRVLQVAEQHGVLPMRSDEDLPMGEVLLKVGGLDDATTKLTELCRSLVKWTRDTALEVAREREVGDFVNP